MDGVANLLTVNRDLGLNVVGGLKENDCIAYVQVKLLLFEARVRHVATINLIGVVPRRWAGGSRAQSYGDVLRHE